MAPWLSPWWPEIIKCAERGGHSGQEVIVKVLAGHAVGWPVNGGYLVLCRAENDALVVWIGVGKDVRKWFADAEREVGEFARQIGCNRLRIEGRKGWQRVLPHWTRVGEDLELPLT